MMMVHSITKDQKARMDILKSYYKDDEAKMLEHFIGDKRGWNPYVNLFTKDLSLNQFIEIVLYGSYKVEKSPEDYVADYFNSLDPKFTADGAKRYAIVRTLNTLGIKIKGVNDDAK